MNGWQQFCCDFGGATCTIRLMSRVDPEAEPQFHPKMVWTGTRTAKMFPDYLDWLHTVNASISKTVNHPHTCVIQDWSSQPTCWELWVYHPDGNKECLMKGDGVFQKI